MIPQTMRQKVQEARDNINRMALAFTLRNHDEQDWRTVDVSADAFLDMAPGVHMIVCPLNDHTDKMTFVNVVLEAGAVIKPHEHDRIEWVFILQGMIEETVSKRMLVRGDVMTIPSGQVHGWRVRQKTLATDTFEPAYPRKG